MDSVNILDSEHRMRPLAIVGAKDFVVRNGKLRMEFLLERGHCGQAQVAKNVRGVIF